MGGEGSMMNANVSLKNNRNLLSKKIGNGGLSGNYSNVELAEFPKATPHELKRLREKLQKENKQIRIKQYIILAVVMFVLISIIICYSYFNLNN